MSVRGGTGSASAIHTRVLADALSETSNDIKSLELSCFKISSRSEVEQLGSLGILCLDDIVLDVEDKTGFMYPILLALASVPDEPRGPLHYLRLSCVEAASNGASVVSL
jgi:hypothetical protein